MKDPHYRIEQDPALGVAVRYVRLIQDNDRGDEDPSEPPRWSIFVTALYPVTFAEPIHQLQFVHEVKL